MPKARIQSRFQTLARLALAACLSFWTVMNTAAGTAAEAPIEVEASIAIRTGDWMPLPREEMRRAAADTALSRLTDAGRLSLAKSPSGRASGRELGTLALDIALIGPAETAKLTMTLDVAGSATLVSTASISVHGLDHGGIYDAFEHVGEQAADRLVAKLNLLEAARQGRGIRADARVDDPERRKTYEAAQIAKREGRYAEAQSAFEAVAASASDPDDPLRRLAEDELRYGLLVFEAQQALNTVGRVGLSGSAAHSQAGRDASREAALTRAENLYRQIQAENPYDVQRVTEAQRNLDSLLVARGALANAQRAMTLSRLQPLRMTLMEFIMSEGECPDERRVRSLVSQMNLRVEILQVTRHGDRGQRYRVADAGSRLQIDLLCDESSVEIAEVDAGAGAIPAARR
jgi:tetratricopeptide (TPR) repeat protein